MKDIIIEAKIKVEDKAEEYNPLENTKGITCVRHNRSSNKS